jgi:hypothetical protein
MYKLYRHKLYREQIVSAQIVSAQFVSAQFVSDTNCIGHKLYRAQIVSGTNCIGHKLYLVTNWTSSGSKREILWSAELRGKINELSRVDSIRKLGPTGFVSDPLCEKAATDLIFLGFLFTQNRKLYLKQMTLSTCDCAATYSMCLWAVVCSSVHLSQTNCFRLQVLMGVN